MAAKWREDPTRRLGRLAGRYGHAGARLAGRLARTSLSVALLPVFRQLQRARPDDGHLRRALAEALDTASRRETSAEQKYRLLREMGLYAAQAPKAIKLLLRSMASLERLGKPSTLAAARRLNELLGTSAGRKMLGSAAEIVAADFPDSNFLLFIRATWLAKAGRIEAAQELVNAALNRARALHGAKAAPPSADVQQTIVQVGRIWRVIDAITRDDMAWSAYDGAGSVEPADEERRSDEPAANESEPFEQSKRSAYAAPLALAEPLIQTRRQDHYLRWCRKTFDAAKTVDARLEAVRAMLRQGLRPMPTYHDAYCLAAVCFGEMRDEIRILCRPRGQDARPLPDGGVALVRTLATALFVARKLRLDADTRMIEDALLALSPGASGDTSRWTIASTLIASDEERFHDATQAMIRSAPRLPSVNREIEGFVSWALEAHDFDAARRLYESLPEKLRRTPGLMNYSRILAAQGLFAEALELIRSINAVVISNPRRMSPISAWTNLRKEGEMAFCARTAELFGAVAQPRRPKGVVFVLPRNVDHLRRYPLVVLMELKKQGWAVVPLVEGLLPYQPTDVPAIDQLNGCIRANGRVKSDLLKNFSALKDFTVDISKRILRWNDIDLGQALWEEAAINRRRYSVDFTCPSLQEFLQRHVTWTEANAVVIQNAHQIMTELQIPGAVMTLSQSRLPDVLNRLYCESYGDPETFFCIHSSNGYENYFSNFAANVSTKTVLKNMTAFPNMRTASFPSPGEFDAWFQSQRETAPEPSAEVLELTKRRQTVKNRVPNRTAESDERLAVIEQWRAEGGNVACVFGKITCDLAAPSDGGPAHRDMKDWLNHTIDCVRDSRTFLLIKPHPHERRNEIGTFLTEKFVDLIEGDLPPNVTVLGHDWFSIYDLTSVIDLGVVYNGTVAVELGALGVPAVLCSSFAPIDYPVGQCAPRDREHYRRLLRFEEAVEVSPDLSDRSNAWIRHLSGDEVTVPYRYHARPVTNVVVYPPWWFDEDVNVYLRSGDSNVSRLVSQVIPRAWSDQEVVAKAARSASA